MGLVEWVRRLFGAAPEAAQPGASGAAHGTSPFGEGAGPARLIVLRHAEKSGDKRDPRLSLPGRQRAERLADFIPATFGRPEFLIAARTSERSRRPVETLEPLAAALALEIRARLDDDESAALVSHLADKGRYRAKLGVICWRHSELPGLVDALGAPAGTLPEGWHETDYTTVVALTYPGDGTARATRHKMPF